MINKQKIWFLTLFTLILVLSVYYITMPNDVVLVNSEDEITLVMNETDEITMLEEEKYEEYVKDVENLNIILTGDATSEEKNNAYSKIKTLEEYKVYEDKIRNKIKEKFDLESSIKIEDYNIKITVKSNDNSYKLANNIIRCTQEIFEEKMNITVKFI